jgi:hypothetical protein
MEENHPTPKLLAVSVGGSGVLGCCEVSSGEGDSLMSRWHAW